MTGARRSWLYLLAVPLFLGGPATGSAEEAAVRCSKPELPSQQPSLFFTGRATAVTRDAPVRGAGQHLEETFSGSVRAQLFDVDRLGGRDAGQVPDGARQVLVVLWGYTVDCRPVKWAATEWVEVGTAGLVYGQLRAREDWVEGVPTIDMHNPHQLPYPRHALRPITADDAFTLLSLMPVTSARETQGTDALIPLAAWIRERPELGPRAPGSFLHSFLTQMTDARIRDIEPEIAGTYRFHLDLEDGRPRTFYGRTESHAAMPHRVEAGHAFMDEVRPPRAEGYGLIVAVAQEEDALPAHRGADGYGYVYVDLVPEIRADGTRSWRAGAELALAGRAFPDDVTVQALASLDPRELRYFLQHNVPPATDAAFRMLPDGRVTFEQHYQLFDGTLAVLRGERTSTVVMPSRR